MEPRRLTQQETESMGLLMGRGQEVEREAMLSCLDVKEGTQKFLSEYSQEALDEAYERCRLITADYAKTFYLGTKLMDEEKRRATARKGK